MLVPRALLAEAEAIAAKVTESVVIGATGDEATTMGGRIQSAMGLVQA